MNTTDIQNRIAQVVGVHSKAIAHLKSKLWTGGATGEAIARLEGYFAKSVTDWKNTAFNALKSNSMPYGKSWNVWIEKGNIILRGIAEQAGIGETGNLEALKEVAKEAPATSVKFVKDTAVDLAKATGEAASSITTGLLSPFVKPVGILILVLGAGLVLINSTKKTFTK